MAECGDFGSSADDGCEGKRTGVRDEGDREARGACLERDHRRSPLLPRLTAGKGDGKMELHSMKG